MTFLPSENRAYGFYGTCRARGLDADLFWEQVSDVIAGYLDGLDGFAREGIRDFLDSRDGRHLADQVINGLVRTNPHNAIRRAVAEFAGRRISARTSREYGIPKGLPALVGWVHHYAIEAETISCSN